MSQILVLYFSRIKQGYIAAQLEILRHKRLYSFIAIILSGLLCIIPFFKAIQWAYTVDAFGFNEHIGTIVKDNQYYQPARTFWDWLQLLIVPFAIALSTIIFGQIQSGRERIIANANLQESILQSYLNQMSEALIDKELRSTDTSKEKKQVARTRTIITLRRLDGVRKSFLIRFLYESELIGIKEKLIIDLGGADLRLINLIGINLTSVSLQNVFMDNSNLQGVALIASDFSHASLQNTDLSQSNLGSSIFFESNLTKSNLLYADMINSTFDNAILERANLKFATCINTGFSNAKLSKSRLKEANFENAVFEKADLKKADLRHTNCAGTDFCNANLRDADLRNADLRGANFERADLCGANLQGANLANTKLSDAKYDARTRFPKQFTPPQNMDYCR